MPKGILYLIPTVLAENTAERVLSPQIKEVITHTDHFFVEELRTARRFISSLKTGKVIENLHFYELSKSTSEAQVREYMRVLEAGYNAGIISEAGCPGVADPGSVAVRLAHKAGIKVVPLVGPSSILLALMASGFSGQSFVFHGYLPIDRKGRIERIKQLEKNARELHQTQIFMETPFRNNQILEDILAQTQPNTQLCIAANVTAPDERIQTKSIGEWRKTKLDLHKIPTIFLLFL